MKFMFQGKPFCGVTTALVTPFDKNNVIDDEKMTKVVNWQIENGIKGLLVLGGSGEYVSLSMEERVHAIRSAVKAAAGRIPIIAGVLEPGIQDAIQAAKLFQEAGAAIPLVLTPYYVNPTQEGIYDFFKAFDQGFQSPFLIYNIPYKNVTNIKPATFARIVEDMPNCAGIKECSVAFADCVDIVHRVGDKCTVMSGEDLMMGGHVLFGAEAAIIASANLIPAAWAKYFQDAKARDLDAVIQFQKTYYPLFDLLFAEINPAPLKYAMRRIGMDMGEVSTPLQPCSEPLREKLDKMLTQLGLL
ncbi:4-hydroxy-tetrahydrodipicolinate synthase [Pseudoflavonifractor phocaeensis]|uniref:4-hydroxy-tetrahydrodipicolinate synthase n=1 Tax=Pseudoflavonifractor phocaeensis TaxID=1870988 RepID=UPI0025A4843E|nr:4-hydroxy-tetrahydrodipicolinate synthase [Pseudoflavonifractor phocaeensis]MDM8237863.1 4-hydroxy-tetrahydrodipicolinate synthase [Pseudoflavonifractor phocaeensis]